MRRLALQIWDLLRDATFRRPSPRKARRKPLVGLRVRAFEQRILPAASTLSTLNGVVFVDGNDNGLRDVQEGVVRGVTVTLTNLGNGVAATATTDTQGAFTLRSVQAGTYQLTASPGANFLRGATVVVGVAAGQNTSQDLGIGGLVPGAIHPDQFLSSSTEAAFHLAPSGATANSPPFVQTAIANFSLASGSTRTIDMAAHFADFDMRNSAIRFDTSQGAMTVNLFDAQAPQTVANFYDYVLNSRYDGTIIHRNGTNDTNPSTKLPVLQGGGFTLQPDPTQGFTFPAVVTANEPTLQNEFGLPNTVGTIAMAKTAGDPNSATSQFFFNLADNSTTLGASNNGGFSVFGSVASDPTSQAVFQALQTVPVKDESATNSAFNTLPLNSYTGTNFPVDTMRSNYLVVNDIAVVTRNESLTYSVSNSNPGLINAQFQPNHPELLTLTPVQPVAQVGTATITVRATDQFGATADTSFVVTVVPLTITSPATPVTTANQTSTSLSGTVEAGATVKVVADDGAGGHTSASVPAVVTGTNWTASPIDVSALNNGTITYTATATDAAGNSATITQTTTKTP